VFFVERETPDGINARNVFILTSIRATESVTTARAGRLETAAGDRFLVLERGQRNQVDQRTGEYTVSAFESYRVLADEERVRRAQRQPPKAMNTIDLIRERGALNEAELSWRFGMLLAGGNLLLLGLGLAAANPRRPSNWNLVFALLAFVVYFNLVNLSQSVVAHGRLSMGAALVTLHGGAFALALALLWWRDHPTSLGRRRRRPPSTAAAG
jgi:lipopolysaccharide export system permease protein